MLVVLVILANKYIYIYKYLRQSYGLYRNGKNNSQLQPIALFVYSYCFLLWEYIYLLCFPLYQQQIFFIFFYNIQEYESVFCPTYFEADVTIWHQISLNSDMLNISASVNLVGEQCNYGYSVCVLSVHRANIKTLLQKLNDSYQSNQDRSFCVSKSQTTLTHRPLHVFMLLLWLIT